MAVLLKNLVARVPQQSDLTALSELMTTCARATGSVVESSLEQLQSHWHRPDFHLATDAWVIVTTRGQIVGFACVWHEDYTEISTFVCVDPEYRGRGIGTLLLRMVEVRARQFVRLAQLGARVVLRGLIGKTNEDSQRLFECEGYTSGLDVLRISFSMAEDTGAFPVANAQRTLRADVSLKDGRLVGATPLYDRDGLCSVQVYKTYEKELRPATISVAEASQVSLDLLHSLIG